MLGPRKSMLLLRKEVPTCPCGTAAPPPRGAQEEIDAKWERPSPLQVKQLRRARDQTGWDTRACDYAPATPAGGSLTPPGKAGIGEEGGRRVAREKRQAGTQTTHEEASWAATRNICGHRHPGGEGDARCCRAGRGVTLCMPCGSRCLAICFQMGFRVGFLSNFRFQHLGFLEYLL